MRVWDDAVPSEVRAVLRRALDELEELVNAEATWSLPLSLYRYRYTEHEGRYGVRVTHPEVLAFLSSALRRTIAEALGMDPEALALSAVWACVDEGGFSIPRHVDDVYKRVSCVLYMGENFEGTTYLDEGLRARVVTPEEGRLCFFESRGVIHEVRKSELRRHTVQFHYEDVGG